MKWQEQFEIIAKVAKEKFSEMGDSFSQAKAEQFLGVSKNKWAAWKRGQRPNADDLQAIANKLGFRAEWLLLGEGEPTLEEMHRKQGRDLATLRRMAMDLALQVKRKHGADSPEGDAAEKLVAAIDRMRSTLDDAVGQDLPDLSDQELNEIYYPQQSEPKPGPITDAVARIEQAMQGVEEYEVLKAAIALLDNRAQTRAAKLGIYGGARDSRPVAMHDETVSYPEDRDG